MTNEEKERRQKERDLALRKESQIKAIKVIGKAGKAEQKKDAKDTEEKGKKELNIAKEKLTSSNKNFQQAVKGQFGKKVTEVLDKQKDMLNTIVQ